MNQTSICLNRFRNKGGIGTVKQFKFSSIFSDRSKAVLLLWILFVICVSCLSVIQSVHCSFVVTCWERADLLALFYLMFSCVLSLSHMVSWVKFSFCLYRFLIFAFFFTLNELLALEKSVLHKSITQ